MRIDSRNIDDLRPDVAANVHIFVRLMSERGYSVGFSSTYRNDEQQAYLYEQGRTRPGIIVTNSKVTTFHGVRLAFDIFQNIIGKEYNDAGFWDAASEILLVMGFSWGWYWTSFKEKAHFQWDDHLNYSGTQARSGDCPPDMPLYEEEEEMAMTDAEFAEYMARYLSVTGTGSAHSAWAETATSKLMSAGILNGDGKGNYGWGKPITREGMAQVLYNLVSKIGLLSKLA